MHSSLDLVSGQNEKVLWLIQATAWLDQQSLAEVVVHPSNITITYTEHQLSRRLYRQILMP